MRTMITVAITNGTLMAKIQRQRRDVDEPAAGQRADDHRDAAPRRPRADRRAALVGREGRDDDGQRARGQQRAEDALQGAPRDQHLDRRGQRADHAHDAEAGHADGEDPPLAVEVAERAADEDQRAEREQVGVGDPLLAREAAAEVALDGRQRDVDRGRVERRDERARGSRPAAPGACGDRSRDHATEERTCVCGGSGGWALPDRRQQETRSRTAWGALRRVRPRGGRSRLQSGGPRNPWASLSAVRFRVEGQLMVAPDGGQEPLGGDPANTGDFRWAVARPRTLGRAADRGEPRRARSPSTGSVGFLTARVMVPRQRPRVGGERPPSHYETTRCKWLLKRRSNWRARS